MTARRPQDPAVAPERIRETPIVGVRFLNARPLLAGLEAGIAAPFRYGFRAEEPAACADQLASGEAVAGLIPVAAFPFLPSVWALRDLGVASRSAVTSVLLVARTRLEEIRTLAAHTASRTSVALARLLLHERWGADPDVVAARPPLEAMLADADAAVIIGDPALAIRGRTGLLEIDLAQAWAEWTGLPFVFAVWGIAAAAPTGVSPLLRASLEYAEQHWEKLVERWAGEHDVPVDETRRYLGEVLTYRLGDDEHRAIVTFLARAAACGLLPPRSEVWRAA